MRYYSLDVFRGATVALMILVNNQGSHNHLFSPLSHAAWHGCTPTDLVFPFFLFAVGNALSFVMPRFRELGTGYFMKKIVRRTLLIFLIGFLLNWFPFFRYEGEQLVFKTWTFLDGEGNLIGIRIMGVLQRIALSYFLAALLLYFYQSKWPYISGALLLLYWWLCYFFGGDDPYSFQGFFGTAVDNQLLGGAHLHQRTAIPFDPEGLMPTMSSAVEVMLGYAVGRVIQIHGKTYLTLKKLLLIGAMLTMVGLAWGYAFPINKKIWTSSYTLYTSGLATLVLTLVIYLVEFRKWNGTGSKIFDVFGKNPLFIFVLSGLVPRLLSLIRIPQYNNGEMIYLSPLSWVYEYMCKNISTDLRMGSLFYALLLVAFYWLIAFILDRKKIYIKV